MTGGVRDIAAADTRLDFAYRLIRAWEQPVGSVLDGKLGTLPLAPVCVGAEPELVEVFRQIERRLERDADPPTARELSVAAYIIAGLRHAPELISRVLSGVREMKESATYQAILAEGRAEEALKILLRLGRRRWGHPPTNVLAALNALTDVSQLEAMTERVSELASGDHLLKAKG